MTITERMTEIVTHLDNLEPMTDEDYTTTNYWDTNIIGGTGGSWITQFCIEIGLSGDPDRLTAITILKNIRQIQCIFAFTEVGTDLSPESGGEPIP